MNRILTRNLVLAAVAAAAFSLTAQANAYPHEPHGRDGYRDGNHHYHPYSYHNGHRGYWDQRGGVRVFITI